MWGLCRTCTQPRLHGPGIIRNVSTKIIGRQPGDAAPLATHLALNQVALNEIKRMSAPRKGRSADVLLVIGEKAETTQTIRLVPTPVEYWVCTTFPRKRGHRTHCLEQDPSRPALRFTRTSRADSRMGWRRSFRYRKRCRGRWWAWGRENDEAPQGQGVRAGAPPC